MTRYFTIISLLIGLALTATMSRAADNRVYLISQYDFGAKTGFYLDFENTTQDNNPAPLSHIHLILGVGDGANWRFLNVQPAFAYDRDYTVVGEIGQNHDRLLLDGRSLAESEGGIKPENAPLTLNDSPGWAQAPAEYVVVLKSVTLTPEGLKPLTIVFSQGAPAPIRLFDGRDTRRVEDFRLTPGKSLTISATFRLEKRPADLRALAPFIDRYGQSVYADWPQKIKSDAALKRAASEEAKRLLAFAPSGDQDSFGGYKKADWKAKATGYYTVTKRGERWWLLSPGGNPTFYTGIDTAPALAWDTTPVTGREFLFAELPPQNGATAVAWSGNPWGETPPSPGVALHSLNMLRKYGADWQRIERERTVARTRAWGFSGLGKWCDRLPGMPSLPVLSLGDVPKVARHADIFDPAIKTALEQSLRKQIEPSKTDPYVVGWSIGNEYDEIITPDEIRQILSKPATVPAKQALANYALTTLYHGDMGKMAQASRISATKREELWAADLKLPDTDIEALRLYYADTYYETLYRTVKRIDPNHLYFGFWISFGWWVNEEDWRLSGRHCDVLGYDRYAYAFSDATFDRLARETGKPIFCGEFAFPPGYHGERGYGFYPSSVEDDADAARYYTRWLESAATSPYCVGVCWFQYRDEPLTGRGPGQGTALVHGEHFAFGLVDVTDQPKWDLLIPLRKANLNTVRQRLKP